MDPDGVASKALRANDCVTSADVREGGLRAVRIFPEMSPMITMMRAKAVPIALKRIGLAKKPLHMLSFVSSRFAMTLVEKP